MVYAVTASGKLINFNLVTPSAINSTVNITGLQPGELVVGIDFRPRTGQLFGVTTQSRVYTIDTTSGASVLVGTVPFTPGVTGFAYGVDFNPVPDLIRVVTNQDDQNLRVNPNTGVVAGVDTTLAFAATDRNAGADPNIVGAAYTNSYSGATATTLYGIDSALDILVTQGSAVGVTPVVSPNTGQLFTVGSLGVDTTEMVGFDIAAPGDSALASLTSPGLTTSSLYWIDLPTGTATLISQIGGGEQIRDIAIVTRVETIFALSQSNNLISFNSGMPGTPISSRPITGIPDGESLVGLDFRPATGELYSFGSSGSVYTVNTSTGLATLVSTSVVAAAANNPLIGFDFNPAPDLIRLVSGNDQNLRVNPNNSALAGTDGALAYDAGDLNANANPNVVASAYLNNVAGPTPPNPGDPATVLYGIDSNLDVLVSQGTVFGVTPVVSPNTGRLFTIGGLTMGGMPVDITDDAGFDIAPETGAAFASLTLQAAPTSSMLVTVNLTNGAVTPIGTVAGGEVIRDIAIGVRVDKVYAITASNTLVSFNSRTPGTIMNTVPISGMQAGETLVGIDFRPSTGRLYGLSSNSSLYTIDAISGIAAPVGLPLTPPLVSNSFGFDFNPVPDLIRVINNQGQNLRLNPNSGILAGTDGMLIYGPGDNFAGQIPAGVAASYINSFAGTTSTTLFVIDSAKNTLARQGSAGGAPISPNTGQTSTVGPLGQVITSGNVGFDISDCGNKGYASFTPLGATGSQLFNINLRTGAATPVGANSTIAVSGEVRDIAVQTNFTPSAVDAGFMVVNSASYTAGPAGTVAPDSVASLLGSFQTQGGQPFIVPALPRPTTLGGISVTFNGVTADFYYASNSQINVRVPNLSDGPAIVQVTSSNMGTRTGRVNIVRGAPGIFTADGSGRGTVYALTTFDAVTYQPVIDANGNEVPILPLDANGRRNVIGIFGTGFRNTPPAAITATIQSITVPVVYSGVAIVSSEIDQFNIIVSDNLAGLGRVNLQIRINDQVSNVVTFTLGGTPPAPARQTDVSKTPIDRLRLMPNDIKSMSWSIRAPLSSEEYADRRKSERLR